MARDRNKEDITYADQTIISVDLEKEMKKSYIDYAMSVFVGRALPDERDGYRGENVKNIHRDAYQH